LPGTFKQTTAVEQFQMGVRTKLLQSRHAVLHNLRIEISDVNNNFRVSLYDPLIVLSQSSVANVTYTAQ